MRGHNILGGGEGRGGLLEGTLGLGRGDLGSSIVIHRGKHKSQNFPPFVQMPGKDVSVPINPKQTPMSGTFCNW